MKSHTNFVFGHAFIYISKFSSVDEWIKKAVVHWHNGILLGYKNEGNVTLCYSVDGLESIMLSEMSQSEKDKYYMVSLICGI